MKKGKKRYRGLGNEQKIAYAKGKKVKSFVNM